MKTEQEIEQLINQVDADITMKWQERPQGDYLAYLNKANLYRTHLELVLSGKITIEASIKLLEDKLR